MRRRWAVLFGKLWRSEPKVLIVADDRPDPALASAFLRRPGVERLTSPPGAPALALARSKQPRLIIEDLEPPDTDGPAFRRSLRENRETRSIPLVLVADPHLGEQATAGQPADLLFKPVDRRQLYDVVSRYVPLPNRRGDRVEVNLRIRYVADGRVGQAFCRDLSINGAFIKTDRSLPAASSMEIRFSLPGEPNDICCGARVVRSSVEVPRSDRIAGFAIEFERLADADTERLENFILDLGR